MKLNYNLKLNIDNGYKCVCCCQSWNIESVISIKTDKTEKFFQKKSNHKILFSELSKLIFEKGCEKIKNIHENGNFLKTFYLEYSFYSKDLEDRAKFVFNKYDFIEYNLEGRWNEFRKEVEINAEKLDKLQRIAELENELENLKNDL